jgi:hypothetical protein
MPEVPTSALELAPKACDDEELDKFEELEVVPTSVEPCCRCRVVLDGQF